MLEIQIWPYEKVVYAQPIIRLGELDAQIHCDFDIEKSHISMTRQLDLVIVNKNKNERTCQIVNFADSIDHRVKWKEMKREKYQNFVREQKKQQKKNYGTWMWQWYQS